MVSFKELRDLALSLPDTTEEPHFDKTSFRIRGGIFATYERKSDKACVKLSLDDQSVFSSAGEPAIYPVANSWGAKGWTFAELKKIDKQKASELVKAAYLEVSQKKNQRLSIRTRLKKSEPK